MKRARLPLASACAPPAREARDSAAVLPSSPISSVVASHVRRRTLPCGDVPERGRLPVGVPSDAVPGIPTADSPAPLDASPRAPLPRAAAERRLSSAAVVPGGEPPAAPAADTLLPVPGRQKRKADTLAVKVSEIVRSICRGASVCLGRGIPNCAATFRIKARFSPRDAAAPLHCDRRSRSSSTRSPAGSVSKKRMASTGIFFEHLA